MATRRPRRVPAAIDGRAPRAEHVEALVPQNLVDPAEKSLLLVEGRQVLVGFHEGVLGRIHGLVPAAKQPGREVEERAMIPLHQGFECRRVACEAALDQDHILFAVHIHRAREKVGGVDES